MNGLQVKPFKNAVILLGVETDLLQLSNGSPIWMLPVLNRPLVQYTIDLLKENGFERVTAVLPVGKTTPGFLTQISGIDIRVHGESSPKGTAGNLKDLEKSLADGPFLVIDGNFFAGNFNLDAFLKFHAKKKSIATIGVHRQPNEASLEDITITDEQIVEAIEVCHHSIRNGFLWKSSGIYAFEPSVLNFITENTYMDIKEQLIPVLRKESLNTYAFETENRYHCCGCVNDYYEIHRTMLLNDASHDYLCGFDEISYRVWVGKNVTVSSRAYLLGPIVVGDNCTIDEWAQIIGPAVIGNNCHISEGAVVRESLLFDNISISGDSRIEYSILTEGLEVPEKSDIRNTISVNKMNIAHVNLIPADYEIKGILDLSEAMSAVTKHKMFKIVKRSMDIVFSLLALLILSPVMAAIAAAVKMDSSGPVFYKQKRCGLNGKLFTMIKFRTMVVDAEKLQDKLAGQNATDGPMFKMVDDPRITKLGMFLRKSSLDELPQLFNVLKGEMSLVGPRPLIMDEMKFSPSWRDTRLKIKPGITGLWQVHGRSTAPFHDWIRYDLEYVRRQSIWTDLKIMLKTIRVVFNKIGAY